jgi:carbon-monoxide dehydrogenase catalytic subunit
MVVEKTLDRAVQQMINLAKEQGIATVWDRRDNMLPQCGFGELGVCCRNCLQGPCRIDPFGEGAQRTICGATADNIVARNLVRAISAGTAAHSGHAKHLAHTLRKVAEGKAPAYAVRDEQKLMAVAARLGIEVGGRSITDLALAVAEVALADFSEKETLAAWVATTVTPGRVETLARIGAVPTSIDGAVSEMMHRTLYGVDDDPINLLLDGIKCAVADFAGCYMATDLADILFGTPQPVITEANLGVLKENAVNIALHGHNPVLSECLASVAAEMQEEARAAGAPQGLNLVGVCCTGNELLMRRGIPPATHSVSQEAIILTGAVDGMVVDYQCIMPALGELSNCYHTKLITTMPLAKITGAVHVDFTEEQASEKAKEIIRLAIEAYKHRDPARVRIPKNKSKVIAGFSAEAIVGALGKLDASDPLKPLIDNIVNGNIQGVVLFAGCNNVRVPQDQGFLTIAKALAQRDVLLLATGCGAGAFSRHGLLSSEATTQYAGPGLKAVLGAIGEANGLGGPLPPVLHMGSCVDNSRAAAVAVALANKLGVDLDKLPVVASAPEPTSEKAVAIGTWAVAAGLPTHLGVVPPVLGSPVVTKVLTEGVKDLLGGYFIVETDPAKAADRIFGAIQERRRGLGLAAKGG